MTPEQRFDLKARLMRELSAWDYADRDLVFGEVHLPLSGVEPLIDIVSMASDDQVTVMRSLVFGVGRPSESVANPDPVPSCWNPGQVRVFISHSAKHKVFVSEVSSDLAVAGIHGFVAHETMTVAKSWQDQIENALKSAQPSLRSSIPSSTRASGANRKPDGLSVEVYLYLPSDSGTTQRDSSPVSNGRV